MSTISTICQLIDFGLNHNSGVVASTKKNGLWTDMPVTTFRKQINEYAAGFYSLGVRKGHRVALHSENSTQWLIIDQALLSLGAVSVPIYTTQPKGQITHIVQDAGVCGYVVSSAELYENYPDDLNLPWVLGIHGKYSPEMITAEDLMERGAELLRTTPDLVNLTKAAIKPSDLATLCYTSGTTGQPKGVMLTHNNITTNAIAIAERLPFEPPARVLSYLPLSHSLERVATIFYLSKSCPIYFVEDPQELLEDLQHVRPVHMTTVPRVLEKVHAGVVTKAKAQKGPLGAVARWALKRAEEFDLENPPKGLLQSIADALVYKKVRAKLFGGKLIALTSGGAKLSPKIQAFINGLGVYCGQGYGLTETSPVITLYEPAQLRPGSVGTPIRNVEVKIAEDGEILTKGPHVMKGYYNMPEETSNTITEDGWLHTGDIGKLDDDGRHLYITDRKKQLFKLSTGKYIAPAPIEVKLASAPLIEHAVILGPDFKYCAALIVVDKAASEQAYGSDPDRDVLDTAVQNVVNHVNEDLPPWEQVKKFHLILQPFTIGDELTPTLKVRRKRVFAKYQEDIDQLYAS